MAPSSSSPLSSANLVPRSYSTRRVPRISTRPIAADALDRAETAGGNDQRQRHLDASASDADEKYDVDYVNDVPEPISLMSTGKVSALVGNNDIVSAKSVAPGSDEAALAKEELKRASWVEITFWLGAETFGLGSLTLAQVCSRIGYMGYTFANLAFVLLSTWTGLMLRRIKLRYKWFHFYQDCGGALWGNIGWRIIYVLVMIGKWQPVGGNTFLGAIAIIQISNGTICTVACVAIAAVVALIIIQMRTLHGLRYVIVVAFFALFVPAVIMLFDVPLSTPSPAPNVNAFAARGGFSSVVTSIMDSAYAYGAQVFFPVFMSEMKNPADFNKALYVSNTFLFIMFELLGIVVYVYRGNDSASPGFNNVESSNLRRALWGVTLLHTVVITAVSAIAMMHDIFTRIFGWSMMVSTSFRSRMYYFLTSLALMSMSFVIINLIPFFSEFVALGSSSAITLLTYGLPPLFIAELKRREILARGDAFTRRQIAYLSLLYCIMGATVALSLVGLAGVFWEIVENYTSGAYPSPFSCATSTFL